MIVIAPPPRAVSVLRPVLPIGDSMAVAEAGGCVRVDLYGTAGLNVAMLSPADALRLSKELHVLARRLGA